MIDALHVIALKSCTFTSDDYQRSFNGYFSISFINIKALTQQNGFLRADNGIFRIILTAQSKKISTVKSKEKDLSLSKFSRYLVNVKIIKIRPCLPSKIMMA